MAASPDFTQACRESLFAFSPCRVFFTSSSVSHFISPAHLFFFDGATVASSLLFFSFLFFCQATILSVKYPRHCVAVFVFALPPPTSWKVLCTHSLSFCLCCSPSFDLLLWFRMNPNHFPKRATTTLHLSVEASKLACFFAFACVCVCVFVCVCVCACEKKVWGGEDGHLHTRSV